ncbi:MAG: hypothetical protein AAFN59_10140, partial [Pseudomonadota bacterium]
SGLKAKRVEPKIPAGFDQRVHQSSPDTMSARIFVDKEAFDFAIIKMIDQSDAAHRITVDSRDQELHIGLGKLFGGQLVALLR